MTEIHLNAHDRRFVEEQIEAGHFTDADEVVSAALASLGREDERLKAMIAVADAQLDRGEFVTFASADAHADSIIERGMRLLDRKS